LKIFDIDRFSYDIYSYSFTIFAGFFPTISSLDFHPPAPTVVGKAQALQYMIGIRV
jgi:hypothetical protein